MRTNIVLDDRLVEEGFRLTGARTKKELVDRRRRRDLTDLSGKIRFRDGFDHKAVREMRDFHDPG